MEGAKLVVCEIIFTVWLRVSYTIRAFKNYRAD